MDESTQEFMDAVLEGQFEIIKRLIGLDDLGYIGNDLKEHALLKYAISNKRTEIAKLLLTNGAEIRNSLVESPCNTPLHLAVKNDDIEIVNMLLDRRANYHLPNQDGITPLKYAIKNDKKEITELLLNYRPNTHFKPNQKKNYQVVEYLLRLAVNGNSFDGSTLWLSVVKGDIKMVGVVLESGAHVDSNREVLTAAVLCDGKEYDEIVEILLQNGVTVDPEHVNDLLFFHTAVEKGYLKIVEQLLKYGVDVNKQSDSDHLSPLHIAVGNNLEEIVRLLISYGADVNAKSKSGRTPIFYAIENGDLNMTKLLLNNRDIAKATPELLNIVQSDVFINATDGDGKTPLHCVTKDCRNVALIGPYEYNVYEEIAKLLLSRGADINAVTKLGLTPFQLAIHNDSKKVVEAFLEDVDVNATFQDEMTPLHYSASNGKVVIIKMLLSKGANVNAKQKKNNWTPLHYAVCMDQKEVVEVLLRCGARVSSKIIADIKPNHSSIFMKPLPNGHMEIFKILIENGADINARNECNGETLLYIPVRLGKRKEVLDLLKLGASINKKNKHRDTPLDYAKSRAVVLLHYHIAKLKAANLYVNSRNLLLIRNNNLTHFENECKKEISRMKSESIANTHASFYNILSTDVMRLVRNQNIVQALESGDYTKKFPIYADMIECYFKKGIRRNRFLEKSNAFFDNIPSNIPKLPYHCNEKIFSYLHVTDLSNLMNNFKNDDGREELLEQGYRYFHFLFINIPDFSYKLTEKIFSYLSDNDLRNLVEACKSTKICNSAFPPLRRLKCEPFKPAQGVFRKRRIPTETRCSLFARFPLKK